MVDAVYNPRPQLIMFIHEPTTISDTGYVRIQKYDIIALYFKRLIYVVYSQSNAELQKLNYKQCCC